MRWRYLAILFVLMAQLSCKKDTMNPEGSITIFNDFLDFNKSVKIRDGGYYALVSDYIYTDKMSVVKIDQDGHKAWQKPLDRTGSFDSRATQYQYINVNDLDGNGCLLFAVITSPNGAQTASFKKFDQNGNEQPWVSMPIPVKKGDASKLDGFTIDTVVYKKMVTNWDNSITVMAYIRHNNNHSIMLMKYSIVGDTIDTVPGMQPHEYYISKYNTPGGPTTLNIMATSETGYLITASPNSIDHKGFFLKVDHNLNETWRKYYLSPETIDDFTSMTEGTNNNYVIFGKAGAYGDGSSQEDFYLCSISSSFGDKQWERRYRDTAKLANIPRSITRLATGEFLLTGEQSNYNPNGDVQTHVPGTFIYLQKVKATGEPEQLYEYKSSFGFHGNDTEQMDNGGFLILASKHSFGNEAFRDMVIFKTLPNGNFNQ